MKRSAIAAGQGFKRPIYVPSPREPGKPIPMGERRGVIRAVAAVGVVVPKGIKAKPGKRAPTVIEAKWMDKIVDFGCVACWLDRMPARPTAVHHIVVGGRRLGHLFTLGLCDPGHHQGGNEFGLISRHPYKARFEAKYGAEFELLATLKRELGVFDSAEYQP